MQVQVTDRPKAGIDYVKNRTVLTHVRYSRYLAQPPFLHLAPQRRAVHAEHIRRIRAVPVALFEHFDHPLTLGARHRIGN